MLIHPILPKLKNTYIYIYEYMAITYTCWDAFFIMVNEHNVAVNIYPDFILLYFILFLLSFLFPGHLGFFRFQDSKLYLYLYLYIYIYRYIDIYIYIYQFSSSSSFVIILTSLRWYCRRWHCFISTFWTRRTAVTLAMWYYQ